PPVAGRPQVSSADRDRGDVGVLQCVNSVFELAERLRRAVDARRLEVLLVVPDAGNAEGVWQGVLLAINLPRLDGAAEFGDPLREEVGEVLEVTGLGLSANFAAWPDHEDVRSIARLERVRDEGALQVLVLVAGDLNLDAWVGLFELGCDVFPQALLR